MDGLSLTGIVVLCQLSDGSVRSVNTNREEELSILDLLDKRPQGLTLSKEAIIGATVEMPSDFNNYNITMSLKT